MRRIYEILAGSREGDRIGRGVSIALLVLIGANVLASVLETEPSVRAVAPRFFHWFEWGSVAIFTVEYALRLWSSPIDPRYRGRLHAALRPMALVDLVAIAPFYVELFVPGVLDFRFLRVMRLLRVFRLMRIGQVADAFATTMRVLQRKRTQLLVSLAVVLVAIFLSAGAIYVVEHGEPGTKFTSIPQAMWWAVITITSIGYGDMYPETAPGRLIGGLVGLFGICAVALPVGVVSSGFIEEIGRKAASSRHAEAGPELSTAAVSMRRRTPRMRGRGRENANFSWRVGAAASRRAPGAGRRGARPRR